MFISKKKYQRHLSLLKQLGCEIINLQDEFDKMKLELEELRKEVCLLREMVANASKKTVSEKTTTPETRLSSAEVMDQWLNGKEDET